MLNSKLKNTHTLSKRLLELEVFTFLDAIQFIKNLPYGRTKDRANPDLVLEELKGTCSTKHAVIKKLAIELNLEQVKLYLCLFKMSTSNTPKLASVLLNYNLKYIPEAHCVLKIEGDFIDVTNATSSYKTIKKDVLHLVEIQPNQIGDFKVNYHKEYLKGWLETEKKASSFEDFWQIREQCIAVLSQ